MRGADPNRGRGRRGRCERDVTSGAVSVAPAAGLRGAWSHRDWRWLLAANTLAGTANTFYEVVLAAWLLDRTGSAGWLAAGATTG